MANLSQVTDNMLPVSSEIYAGNLAAGIAAGATTVPLLSLSAYNDGDSVVLTVDPGTSDQATFIGKVDGEDVIDVKWTEGNVGASHVTGATVIDYDSATHYNAVTKLLRMFANQDGTLKKGAIQSALNIADETSPDWQPVANEISVLNVTDARTFDIQFAGANYTDRLSKGMKLSIPRIGTVPTLSANFNGTSQYASKSTPAGLTFTDDFTAEAWIWLDPIGAQGCDIIGRASATNNGYRFGVSNRGQLYLLGYNTSYRGGYSQGTVPVGRWVHVAASLDLSANTAKMYIDGVEVSSEMQQSGTVTSIAQVGDVMIGRRAGGNSDYMDGRISDVRLWNGIRTAQNIRKNLGKQLTGSESGLVGYWKLTGDFNDSTTNANHMNPLNGLTASFAAYPFSSTEYANIVTVPSFTGGNTIMTVKTGLSKTLPMDTLGTASVSTVAQPYGCPEDVARGRIDTGWQKVAIIAGFAETNASEFPMVRRIGNIVYTKGVFASTGTSASNTFGLGYVPYNCTPSVSPITTAGSSNGNASPTLRVTPGNGLIELRVGSSTGSYYGFAIPPYIENSETEV